MLIETSGSNMEHDEEKLKIFLHNAMEKTLVINGVSTSEPGKIRSLWELREKIALTLIDISGHCFIYDISLPLKNFYDIVPAMRERVGDLATFVCGFGHLGE